MCFYKILCFVTKCLVFRHVSKVEGHLVIIIIIIIIITIIGQFIIIGLGLSKD
jgi:hypothetical protein